MKKIISFFILFAIASCNQSGTQTRVVDGDPEPPAPSGPKDAWINWTQVEGVDRDQDGVRDDVEIWINNNGQDEYIRKALKQRWKSQVQFINLAEEALDKKDLKNKYKNTVLRAQECLMFFTSFDIKNNISSKYTNMIESLRPVSIAIAQYSERFAGTSGMSPGFYGLYIEGETYCNFSIPPEVSTDYKNKIKAIFLETNEKEKAQRETYEASKHWDQL